MSLILEALKKSEAKRRLGEAPDLETPFAAQRQRRSPLPLIVAAIVIAAGAGWWLLRTPAAPTGAASTPAQAQEKPLVARAPPAPLKQPTANPPAAPSLPQAAPGTKTTAEMSQISQWVPVGQGSMRTVGADRRRAAAAAGTTANPAALPAPPVTAKPLVVVTPTNAPNPVAPAPPKPLLVVTPTNATNPVAAVSPPPGVKKPEPAPEPALAAGVKKPELPTVTAAGTGTKKPEPPSVAVAGAGMQKPELASDAAAGMKKPETAPVAGSDSGAQPYYELPFSVRKDLPSLKLSMHVYAPEPAQRFIILNDSRMVEGNSQEELALREIRPDGAVFEFKGQRFFYPRDGL